MTKNSSPTSSPIRDRIDPFDYASSPNKVDYVATPIIIASNERIATPRAAAWTITPTPKKAQKELNVSKTPITKISTPLSSSKRPAMLVKTPIDSKEKESIKLDQSISKLSIGKDLDDNEISEEDEIVLFSKKTSVFNTPKPNQEKPLAVSEAERLPIIEEQHKFFIESEAPSSKVVKKESVYERLYKGAPKPNNSLIRNRYFDYLNSG
jgi:hypothetical protein